MIIRVIQWAEKPEVFLLCPGKRWFQSLQDHKSFHRCRDAHIAPLKSPLHTNHGQRDSHANGKDGDEQGAGVKGEQPSPSSTPADTKTYGTSDICLWQSLNPKP